MSRPSVRKGHHHLAAEQLGGGQVPWENGYCESFNARLRDELLNGELFYSLAEARIIIEGWRQHYNEVRPHSSIGHKTPMELMKRLGDGPSV